MLFDYTFFEDTGFDIEPEFYIHDHLGNTRVVYTPTVGPYYTGYNLSALIDYFPYGKVLRSYYNGEEERYLTTHHERDIETGLDYRGARFYDSDNGRFLSLDPLADDYVSLSSYSYVAGNPARYTDPDGRSIWDQIIGSLAGYFDNLTGANTRDYYTPDDPAAYSFALLTADLNSVAIGFFLGSAGAGEVAAGTGALLAPEPTVSKATGVVLVTKGQVMIFVGGVMVFNGATNLLDGYNWNSTSSGSSGSGSSSKGSSGSNSNGQPDFAVDKDGTAVPLDQQKFKQGMDNAYPSTPSKDGSGVIYPNVPTQSGKVDVRVMPGNAKQPTRTVVTHPGTNSPKTPSGKQTSDKGDNHIIQHNPIKP